MSAVEFEKLENNIAGVTLNRPDRLNAIDGSLINEMDNALDALSSGEFRAAILTGARISELLSLRWEHIRREEMELHLPDTKSGFSRRPMSAATATSSSSPWNTWTECPSGSGSRITPA